MLMTNPLYFRPPTAERSEQYVAAGWWRTESFVDDLRRAAAEVPDQVALIGWRHREARLTRITFSDLAIQVEQLARGLAGMGILTGTAVAFQLPNWWETNALTLACTRIGAIAVPVPMWFGARDLERMLAATGAAACVVTELWDGVDGASDKLALKHDDVCGVALQGSIKILQCLNLGDDANIIFESEDLSHTNAIDRLRVGEDNPYCGWDRIFFWRVLVIWGIKVHYCHDSSL